MIVISLTKCPPSLRGDLTKWLQEIDIGVFAGHVTVRVRDELWQKVVKFAREGRAIMVYSTRNEQRMGFCVHNSDWIPIDFDGLELIMRPHEPVRTQNRDDRKTGYSKASEAVNAKRFKKKANNANQPPAYSVIDLETTGLSANTDKIIELAAVRVENGEIVKTIERFIKIEQSIPESITKLTGITDEILRSEGIGELQALSELIAFIEDTPIVMHNMLFDLKFMRAACQRLRLPIIKNHGIDTLSLAKVLLDDVENLKLYTIADYFHIEQKRKHRSLDDCLTTKAIYDKLIEMLQIK